MRLDPGKAASSNPDAPAWLPWPALLDDFDVQRRDRLDGIDAYYA